MIPSSMENVYANIFYILFDYFLHFQMLSHFFVSKLWNWLKLDLHISDITDIMDCMQTAKVFHINFCFDDIQGNLLEEGQGIFFVKEVAKNPLKVEYLILSHLLTS